MTQDLPIVEIRNLSFSFPGDTSHRPIIDNLSLSIRRGGFVAVVGPSGVGKSTLLRALTGLIPAQRGTIELKARQEPERRRMAMVFQDSRLLPWRRVIDNVVFGCEGLIGDRAKRLARARAAIELVGLGEHANKWPHELSGGQKQRVGIARALAVDPDLLLMDEPFSALDAITRQGLQDELLRLWRATHKSILFITHDLDEAVYLADRVVLLGGSPAQVVKEFTIDVSRPRDRAAAELGGLVHDIRIALDESFADGAGI